jgi:hypothetical protein
VEHPGVEYAVEHSEGKDNSNVPLDLEHSMPLFSSTARDVVGRRESCEYYWRLELRKRDTVKDC